MSKVITVLALSLVSLASSFAGGFGGPPPFTNGSPLPTGVQGTYQASARGSGIAGTIRFAYTSDGIPSATNNTYVFFVDGVIMTGTVDAAIMGSRLAGVLEAPSVGTIPSPGTSSVNEVTSTGGYFNARFNTNSPYYSFKGTGALQIFTFLNTEPASTFYIPQLRTFSVSGVRVSLN